MYVSLKDKSAPKMCVHDAGLTLVRVCRRAVVDLHLFSLCGYLGFMGRVFDGSSGKSRLARFRGTEDQREWC